MKKLTWIFVGGLSAAALGLLDAACSSDPVTHLPPPSSSSSSSGSTGMDGGSSGMMTSSSGSSGMMMGADAGCTATTQPTLKPNPGSGPFCPFSVKLPDGGTKGGNCATGETCCAGLPKASGVGFDESVCKTGGVAACPAPSNPEAGVSAVECTEKDDCTNGQVCCIIAGFDSGVFIGKDSKNCPAAKAENGTRCKTACAPLDLQGCQANSDCPSGKTCVIAPVNVGLSSEFMGACQ
jgi:hypothetical protein